MSSSVRCRWCDREIRNDLNGRPRLYCGTNCRVAAHRDRKKKEKTDD